MNDDEIDLWHRIVKGDETAFSLAFRRHANYVFNYCLARVASWHDAQDLLTEVFLELWRCKEKLVLPKDGIRPMLFMIARSRIAKYWRTRGAKKNTPRIVLPEDVADPADEVATRIDAERKAAAVRGILPYLNQTEWDVVREHIWKGQTQAAAAEALGICEGTLKHRLYAAYRKLRRLGAELDREET